MQASSYTTGRRGSLLSAKSDSSEAYVASPPSPISSEELSPKPFLKPSSNIAAAFQLLRDHYQCVLEDNWNPVQLQPGDYDELWRYLEREEGKLLGYIEDKVHLDYYPKTLEFVVRMPLGVHEHLGRAIEKAIEDQLDIVRGGNNQAATLARKIGNYGSTSIFLEDGTRRDPDGQLRYEGARWPTFITEIANSQSKKGGGKDLSKLADQYITESSGNIQAVLGIFLDYRSTKKATLSIWRPSYGVDQQGEYLAAKETLVSQEFRKADGTRVTQQTLRLPLQYFLPPSVLLPPVVGEQEIIIPFENLAQYLEEAEQSEQDSRTGAVDAMPAGMRKRRREETPPETLSLTDERRFAQEEANAEIFATKEGEDWKEP